MIRAHTHTQTQTYIRLINFLFKNKGVYMKMEMHNNQMKFLQIAMKYMPEAQEQLKEAGIELSMETIQPLLSLFTKVMNDAYELGKAEGLTEEK